MNVYEKEALICGKLIQGIMVLVKAQFLKRSSLSQRISAGIIKIKNQILSESKVHDPFRGCEGAFQKHFLKSLSHIDIYTCKSISNIYTKNIHQSCIHQQK